MDRFALGNQETTGSADAEVALAYLPNLASASDLFRLVSSGASTAGAKEDRPVVSHADSPFRGYARIGGGIADGW